MSEIPEESVSGFQELFKEKYGVEYSPEEASESLRNLTGYLDILVQIDRDK